MYGMCLVVFPRPMSSNNMHAVRIFLSDHGHPDLRAGEAEQELGPAPEEHGAQPRRHRRRSRRTTAAAAEALRVGGGLAQQAVDAAPFHRFHVQGGIKLTFPQYVQYVVARLNYRFGGGERRRRTSQ